MSDGGPAVFSLDLGDDLTEMRRWVHEFAASVIRPAGAEWDEREETPWPVLEEAAKIGLYSLDFFSGQWLEPSGLGIPIAFEELFWGDAGIALSLVGSTLAAVAVASNGTPEHPPRLRRQVMDVNVLFKLDDIPGGDLGGEPPAQRRQELRVEVLPHVGLFEVRGHPREW